MNKEIMRLRYEKPTVESIQLNAAYSILEIFSYIDIEIEEWEDGENLDVI